MDYEAIETCSLQAEQEKIAFPEVVMRLDQAGVDLYYADLLVPCRTYYAGDEAYMVPSSIGSKKELGAIFKAQDIEKAIRLIQQGKIAYQEFLRLVMAAGVVAYFVFIKGRKAVYVGKLGEQYIEPFPQV